MKLCEMNPFVRYARRSERGFTDRLFVASDHRIFYCSDGNAKFQIKNHIYDVKNGTLIFWPAGYEYRIFDNQLSEISGCNFDFTQAHNSLTVPIIPQEKISGMKRPLEILHFEDTQLFNQELVMEHMEVLESKFREIALEYESRRIYFSERCSAILKDILICVVRFSKTDYNGKSSKLAQEILQYIRKNYQKNITNETIAGYFGYHPNYLNSLVLQNTGSSMHQYLLEYRVNLAVDLLQSTDLSVIKIAEEVGIPDNKHFSKLFKNKVGLAPTAYRKKLEYHG